MLKGVSKYLRRLSHPEHAVAWNSGVRSVSWTIYDNRFGKLELLHLLNRDGVAHDHAADFRGVLLKGQVNEHVYRLGRYGFGGGCLHLQTKPLTRLFHSPAEHCHIWEPGSGGAWLLIQRSTPRRKVQTELDFEW